MKISTEKELKPVFRALYNQASVMLSAGKEVNVEVTEFKNKRSNDQNKFLWSVYNNIVLFWTETGFMPDNLNEKLKFINSEIIHCWYKCKFNVKTTKKLNTKEFSEYIDKIQIDMVEQTMGEYEPIRGKEEIFN